MAAIMGFGASANSGGAFPPRKHMSSMLPTPQRLILRTETPRTRAPARGDANRRVITTPFTSARLTLNLADHIPTRVSQDLEAPHCSTTPWFGQGFLGRQI